MNSSMHTMECDAAVQMNEEALYELIWNYSQDTVLNGKEAKHKMVFTGCRLSCGKEGDQENIYVSAHF